MALNPPIKETGNGATHDQYPPNNIAIIANIAASILKLKRYRINEKGPVNNTVRKIQATNKAKVSNYPP